MVSRLQIEGYLMTGAACGCLATIALIYKPVEALPDPYRTAGRLVELLALPILALYLGRPGLGSLFVAKVKSDADAAKLREARESNKDRLAAD